MNQPARLFQKAKPFRLAPNSWTPDGLLRFFLLNSDALVTRRPNADYSCLWGKAKIRFPYHVSFLVMVESLMNNPGHS
jgi:hypothetical protein